MKAALEAGLRLGEVRCLQCDSLLVDDFPRPWIEWNEMLERCLHEGYHAEDLLLSLMEKVDAHARILRKEEGPKHP